ncbi:MAG: ferritin-like domain-containing protein [Kiritimatiellia bacterium]|nr:ferritin-like domain-containing protein [Kiritimatiellia bacterium]
MSGNRVEPSLSGVASDAHRALSSLQEELEAVDYYTQRAENAEDPELRELLLHNRAEEVEHAAMLMEWLRRNSPGFDPQLKTYLFTEKPVTEVEEAGTGPAPQPHSTGTLNIGSLKRNAKET